VHGLAAGGRHDAHDRVRHVGRRARRVLAQLLVLWRVPGDGELPSRTRDPTGRTPPDRR
jgi:hypothetical protein